MSSSVLHYFPDTTLTVGPHQRYVPHLWQQSGSLTHLCVYVCVRVIANVHREGLDFPNAHLRRWHAVNSIDDDPDAELKKPQAAARVAHSDDSSEISPAHTVAAYGIGPSA